MKICRRDRWEASSRVVSAREGRASQERRETDVLHLLLLSFRKVEHLARVLEQNGTLSFGLRNVESARVDGHLELAAFLDDSIRLPTEDHTPHDTRVVERSSKNLDDPDRVDVEVGDVAGHDGEGRLGDERREEDF